MIEPRQVRKRASTLYYDITRRSAPKYWQNGRYKGRVRWHGVAVPYTSDEFATWLLKEIGCNAFLCPYCGAPLDVLSMTLDHDVALHAGGTNEFKNLVPCCSDCNGLKHKLNGAEYRLMRAKLRELPPHVEANILTRLRAGALGVKMVAQGAAARKSQPALVKSAAQDDF